MHLSLAPLSRLRGRKAQHARVTSLTEEIGRLEHWLTLLQADRDAPAAWGRVQRLRGSLLTAELTSTRTELEALRLRFRIKDVRPSDVAPNPKAGPGSPAPASSEGRRLRRGRMRARLVASLAAVVVALAVVKLRLDHTSQAQAQAAVLGVVSDSLLLIARSDDSGSAPQIEVAFNAPAPPAPQHSVTTASPVSLPAVDHFEGWVPSARAIEPAPTLIESLASPVAADETTEASASDEIYSAVAAEPEPATGSVVTLTAVRLREQPARTARTLRSIVAGSRLAVIGASDQGWTQVRARDGTLGWIIASALRPV